MRAVPSKPHLPNPIALRGPRLHPLPLAPPVLPRLVKEPSPPLRACSSATDPPPPPPASAPAPQKSRPSPAHCLRIPRRPYTPRPVRKHHRNRIVPVILPLNSLLPRIPAAVRKNSRLCPPRRTRHQHQTPRPRPRPDAPPSPPPPSTSPIAGLRIRQQDLHLIRLEFQPPPRELHRIPRLFRRAFPAEFHRINVEGKLLNYNYLIPSAPPEPNQNPCKLNKPTAKISVTAWQALPPAPPNLKNLAVIRCQFLDIQS